LAKQPGKSIPFDDSSFHTTLVKQTTEEDTRRFDDTTDIHDTVNAFASPKPDSGLPRKGIAQILSLVGVTALSLYLIYSFISGFIGSFK
jgi:hypothetical protein